ncbi:hypothetical protein H4R35_006144 [Dimargaris xerosporica]|nr:hypothetical protein H4R35_006144 [Dimargaris xerosporica]
MSNPQQDRAHLCIVIGAGSGYGVVLVQKYLEQFIASRGKDSGLHLVLTGRSLTDLTSTADKCRSACSPDRVQISLVDEAYWDDPSHFDALLAKIYDRARQHALPCASQRYSQCTLINNAGTLGDLGRTIAQTDWQAQAQFMTTNFTSFAALCTEFLRQFPLASLEPAPDSHGPPGEPQRIIVNISSLLAIQPASHWGSYSCAKAARDRFLEVIALEEDPIFTKTLNYAPGPLDNAMQQRVRHSVGDATQRSLYTSMHDEGKLVTMESSATKLVKVLLNNCFTSGQHIDYFDQVDF